MTCPRGFVVRRRDGRTGGMTTSHFCFRTIPPLEVPATLSPLDDAAGRRLTRVAAWSTKRGSPR